MDMLKMWKALKRWKWTFAGVTFVALALIALAPETAADAVVTQYQSQAKILLTPPSGRVSGGSAGLDVDMSQSWFADPTILTELLKSEELLTRVQQDSGSTANWSELRGMIAVEPLSQSGYGVKLFQIGVTASDPKESQKITRLLTEEFSTYVQELSAKEFASTRKFIEELVVEAEQRRLQSEESLMAVREKYLGLPSDTEVATKQSSIETQRLEVSQQVPALQAEVTSLKSYLDGQTNSPPWAVLEKTDGSLSSLESAIAENRIKLSQAQEVYTDENEHVLTAKSRLAKSLELYDEGLRNYVSSLYGSKAQELQQLSAREGALGAQLNSLLASQMSPEDRRVVKKLESELAQWEGNHLSLLQQLYQARVVEQGSRRQGSVNVLEKPLPGAPLTVDSPVVTSRSKKLATAIPFCLLLGAGAALLREYLSTSMKLRPRIEEALEIPIIAVIPSVASELTLEWERFKRPLDSKTSTADLVLAGSRTKNGHSSRANGANGTSGRNGTHKNGDMSHGNGIPTGGGNGQAASTAGSPSDDNYRPKP